MIKVTLTNEILKKISEIDENRFSLSTIELPPMTRNRLRKKVLMLQIKLKEIRSQKIRPSKNLDKLFFAYG